MLFWVIHEPGDFVRERTEDGEEGDEHAGVEFEDAGGTAEVAMAVWMAEVNLLARSFELPFFVP